jgi:choline-sulfatase
LADGYPTYATRFGQYGYTTTAFGKMHLQGRDQLKGWQSRPVGDTACGQVDDPIERGVDAMTERPHDDALNLPDSVKWSDEKEIRRAGPGPAHRVDGLSLAGFKLWVDSRFLGTWSDRHQPDRPALVYLGLHDPHYPYHCEEELFRYYLPRVGEPSPEAPMEHPFLGLSPWPPRRTQVGTDIPRREARRARAAYFGKVETMDARYGEALEELRQAGEDLDEWIIVYCSDHGEMLGDHGVWEKQKFYEASARTPLIIRAPRYLPQGTVVDANVSLCDLFPTLCELAGLDVPDGLDGRSLVALAKGQDPDWRDEACSFFLQQGFCNGMVKQGSLKYQWYGHADRGPMPEVLFDLATDPEEMENRIDDPAYADAIQRLRQRREALGYPV